MKGLIKSTISRVISEKANGAYQIPCNFYAVTSLKSLEDVYGDSFGVTGSNLHFVEYSTEKEVIWKYGDDMPFQITDYAYLSRCNDYDIYLYVKTVSDIKVTGFSKEEILSFTEQSNTNTKVNSASTNTVPGSQEITIYLLEGAWNTKDYDGTAVLSVSRTIDEVQKQLTDIRNSKANMYLRNPYGEVIETSTDRIYEITDETGNYAKFYITEHKVK